MRICSRCGGGLVQGAGWEMSASERAGNALEVDEFRCDGCGVRYLHRYEERFSGDIESWSSWSDQSDGWDLLDREQWPTYATAARAQPASTPTPAPADPPALPSFQVHPAERSVVYLPHFNNQAVLEYDRETGLHDQIAKRDFAAGSKYWRGFYLPHRGGFLGVYASSAGPVVFLDHQRLIARRGVTRATVSEQGDRRLFRLEHGGRELTSILYTPLPSGFDCWSQDEAVVDFYVWLAARTDEPKWYDYFTVAAGVDVSWCEPPPEPDPGPRFGEYALVWDRESGEFPERFRVLSSGETPLDFPDRAQWTGSVVKEQLDQLMNRLRARFPPPRYLALTVYGDDWAAASAKFLSIFGSTRL